MAKESKEVSSELWQELEFTPLDGNTYKMKDYFQSKDFVKGDNDTVFVKCVALLRVLKRLFVIHEYATNIVQVPEKSNDWCATIQARFVMSPLNNLERQCAWASCADCNKLNAMPGFERYTTTVAETRAAARSLRNILGIELCSKEEIADATQDLDESLPIQAHQQVLLETKFIGEMGVTMEEIKELLGKQFTTLEELTRTEAALLIEKLNGRRVKKAKKE